MEDPFCLLTVYYERGSLVSLLESDVPISLKQSIHYLDCICKGMNFLNSGWNYNHFFFFFLLISHLSFLLLLFIAADIVHRDLATRNVLLSAENDAVVSDFGFSRIIDESGVGKTIADQGPLKWMVHFFFSYNFFFFFFINSFPAYLFLGT
jgi:serine/threonine protein kinase